MTEHSTFALIPSDDLRALTEEVRELRAMIEGCRIVPAPRWVGLSEAAKAMDCSTATVRRRIARGQLQARGSGRGRQVRVEIR